MSDRSAGGARYPSIQDPTPDPMALVTCLQQLKEAVELLTGQRGTGALSVDVRVAALQAEIDNLKARVTALEP